MRLSTSTNIHNFDQGAGYQVPMEEAVRLCSLSGYTYLDANLCAFCRTGMPITRDGWEGWAYAVRALSDAKGVCFTQAHAYWEIGGTVNADGTHSDGEWGEAMMHRTVRCAEILGVEWMVVHPLTVRNGNLYSKKRSLEHNHAYFSRWAEAYEKRGIGMAIENMISRSGHMGYCANPEDLLELIHRIGSPRVGACLDTGHAHLSGIDVPGAIRLLGKDLKATHIADNHQNADEHLAPFNGTIPWAEVMRALGDIGYVYDFSFEIQSLTRHYPAAVQEGLIRFSFDLGNHLLSLV